MMGPARFEGAYEATSVHRWPIPPRHLAIGTSLQGDLSGLYSRIRDSCAPLGGSPPSANLLDRSDRGRDSPAEDPLAA
jgi:hypothetical protein